MEFLNSAATFNSRSAVVKCEFVDQARDIAASKAYAKVTTQPEVEAAVKAEAVNAARYFQGDRVTR